MAYLWIAHRGAVDNCKWLPTFLDGPAYKIYPDGTILNDVHNDIGSDRSAESVLLMCVHAGKGQWIAIRKGAQARLSVNSMPVLNDIRLLNDRDMLQLSGGLCCFFSTERPAEVVPFPGLEGGKAYCARCRQPIEPGTQAVMCPNPECGVWHHETEGLPCWTHASHCSLCSQTTVMDGSLQWTPEEI